MKEAIAKYERQLGGIEDKMMALAKISIKDPQLPPSWRYIISKYFDDTAESIHALRSLLISTINRPNKDD